MPYTYLGDIAIADVAFEASAATSGELFMEAGTALAGVMVEDPASIGPVERRVFHAAADTLEMLLFEYLQTLIFYKDAEGLLLRPVMISIGEENGSLLLDAEAAGEKIDPEKHQLGADVKAVTLHRFRVWHEGATWKATVVLDI